MNTASTTERDTASSIWHSAPTLNDSVYLRRIDRGGVHWINRPQGRRIVCDSGQLWLCFENQDALVEITLQTGQWHDCDTASKLSIYALEAGSFHLV